MATGRALTTEYERECLRGEHGDQRMYEAKSRIKKRINEVLAEDIDLFENHATGLNAELREVVCEVDDRAAPRTDLERALEYREWDAVEDALARLEDDA